jgi:hypothetical protein
LRAKRAAEDYERQWRLKEKQIALKKAEQDRELREARLKQLHDRRHVVAVEAMKVKQEFFEMIERQKLEESKVQKQRQNKVEQASQFSSEIKAQIESLDRHRQLELQRRKLEATQATKEREENRRRIDQVKERKLKELRELGVADKYCAQIARKMTKLDVIKFSNQPPFTARKAGAGGKGTSDAK